MTVISEHVMVLKVPERLAQLKRDPWSKYDESATRLTGQMTRKLRMKDG